MRVAARVKQMLLTPVAAWKSIGAEKGDVRSVFTGFVIPLSLIPAIASFVGYGFVGADGLLFRISGLYWGTAMAIDSFVTSLAVFLLGTYIIDRMAPGFGAARDSGRSAQLVAYSYTPAWLAGIFYLFPILQELVVLGLYSVYLFYLGIPVLKPAPADQRIAFTISSAIIVIIIRFVVGLLIVNVVYSISGNPFLPYTFIWK
jgi:Yip1-like protein